MAGSLGSLHRIHSGCISLVPLGLVDGLREERSAIGILETGDILIAIEERRSSHHEELSLDRLGCSFGGETIVIALSALRQAAGGIVQLLHHKVHTLIHRRARLEVLRLGIHILDAGDQDDRTIILHQEVVIVPDEEGGLSLVVLSRLLVDIGDLVHIIDQGVAVADPLEKLIPVRENRIRGGVEPLIKLIWCLVGKGGNHLITREEVHGSCTARGLRDKAVARIEVLLGRHRVLEGILIRCRPIGDNVEVAARRERRPQQ